MLRYCLRFLRRPADAEDALQQTFLQAHRALDRGVEPAAEAAWLLAIARNVCLTRSDALKRRATSEVSTEADAVVAGTTLLLPDDDLAEDVRAALAGLPDRQRDALFLREWHELSYAEIARALGTTEAAVETLVFRARRTLARELEPVRRRRAIGLTGLLGWVRNGLAPVAAKVAVGVAAATVTAGAAATAVLERAPATVHVPAPAPAASVPRLVPAPTRARRLHHVARAHPRRATHAVRETHHASAPSTAPATAAPDPAPPSVSPPVASAPPHPAPVEQVPADATATPSVDTPASAAASVVSQAASTASSVADAVASIAADAAPAAAPVTTIVSGTVDKTVATVSQTADAAAATAGGTVSKLLPGH